MVGRLSPELSRWEALGLVLLMLSSLLMWQNYDVTVFRNWFYGAVELGITKLYLYSELLGWEYRVVYPPLAPAMFVASYSASLLVYEALSRVIAAYKLFSPLFESCGGMMLRAVVKLPLVASALALWAVTRRRLGREAAALILLGPPVLVVVAVYNFDLTMAVLVVLAVVAICRARYAASGALLAAAVMFKQSAALALPLMSIYALKHGGKRSLLTFLGSFLALSAALIAPFLLGSPLKAFVTSVAGFHASRLPQGPSPWSLALVLTGYSVEEASKISVLWAPVFAALYALVAVALWRSRASRGALELALAAAFTAYLVAGKVVNPAYAAWAYPFVVYAAYRYERRELLKAYLLLSLIPLAWYSILYLSSVAASAPLFIEEEAKWYPSTYVEKTIIEGSLAKPLAHLVVEAVKAEPLKTLLVLVHEHWPLAAALLVALHTLLAAYTYASALTLMTGGRGVGGAPARNTR